MLVIPHDGHGVVKFVGIDPGTTRPGVGIIDYDAENRKIIRVRLQVLHLEKMARSIPYTRSQSPRFLKLLAFRHFMLALLKLERPLGVASEHPFINIKRPGAVIPLAECLFMLEDVVHEYDPYMGLEKIDPSSIKNSVGVKGNSGEKHAMTEGMKKIPEIMDVLEGDIDKMDNNAIDAGAVAYCSLKRELRL